MCRHILEPTVLSRVSCRPCPLNVDSFHHPCLLPWRIPLLPPITAGCWAGTGEDCRPLYHVATTYPFNGQPGLPSFSCVSLEVLSHADWKVPRQDVNSPIHPCVCHPEAKECSNTRRFGTLLGPPPPVQDLPWVSHPPGHLDYCLVFHQECGARLLTEKIVRLRTHNRR